MISQATTIHSMLAIYTALSIVAISFTFPKQVWNVLRYTIFLIMFPIGVVMMYVLRLLTHKTDRT